MPAGQLTRHLAYRLLPLACAIFACRGSWAPANSPLAEPTERAREISLAEIDSVRRRVYSTYDVIKSLRPGMLVPRDSRARVNSASPAMSETSGIRVYVDDVRVGGVDALSTLPAIAVEHIRWLSPTDAVARYGGGHPSGAIAVTSRRSSPRSRF